MVEGPLLSDHDFITDYSEPTDSSPVRRYRSLADRLGPGPIDQLRRTVAQLLQDLSKELACGPSWVLWLPGGHEDNDLDRTYYSISAFVDVPHGDGHTDINGRMSIVEIERDELEWFREHLGDYDHFAGLAAPEGAIDSVLRALPLASPWPTSRRYGAGAISCVRDPASLSAVLDCERSLFFEEHDNGTRLRLASKAFTAERLREAVRARLPASRP